MSGEDHPMHPLVDADGHITEKSAAFVQHAGEIMDETVASVSGDQPTPAGETCHCGRPVAFGFDGDPTHHRGMCADCDASARHRAETERAMSDHLGVRVIIDDDAPPQGPWLIGDFAAGFGTDPDGEVSS